MSRRHFPGDEIWANNPSEITNPSLGLWANAYESGSGAAPPEAGVHNYVFNRSDEQHKHVEENGMPRWDSRTIYTDGALCLASDGAVYQSQGASNQGNDPTTDSGANWIKLPSVNLTFDPTGSTLTKTNPQDAIIELDDKFEAAGPYLEGSNNLSDLDNASAARGNLGLGSNDTPTFDLLNLNDNEIGGTSNKGDILFDDSDGLFIRRKNTVYKIWDSGNDGSGTELNADLLDGKHASEFSTEKNPTGTSSGDLHTEYHAVSSIAADSKTTVSLDHNYVIGIPTVGIDNTDDLNTFTGGNTGGTYGWRYLLTNNSGEIDSVTIHNGDDDPRSFVVYFIGVIA